MDSRPSLLIVSFTDIANDARVKKQALMFSESYRVTTCGFGEAVRKDIEHISLDSREVRLDRYVEAAFLRLRMFGTAYWTHPWTRRARSALKARNFDIAIANDIETLAVVIRAVGARRTHADLHEYYPGLNDQSLAWVQLRQPYLRWQLARFAPQAASATTVSDTIAERYLEEFGLECGVVCNAAPFQPLEPTQVGSPIRIVHSGGAQPNRRIEVMMKAAARAENNVTLDLYLTQQGTVYADSLHALADSLGERVQVHPPVPQKDLVRTLNHFDVGIHVLPPTNTNNALALPNKFFDYLQARLAMIIGPTQDMTRLLREYDLGVVADDFEVEAVTRAIESLSVAQVKIWKAHANIHAEAGSAERQEHTWKAAVRAIAKQR